MITDLTIFSTSSAISETKVRDLFYALMLYVKEQFGVIYRVSGMHKWLRRNGFSYKKTMGLPHKADVELQKQFITEYNALKQVVLYREKD